MARSLQGALVAAGLAAAGEGEGDFDAPIMVSADVAAIGAEQIRPGLVLLDLDPAVLLDDRRVTYTGRPALRSGPFVCVLVEDGGERTTWTGLTRRHRIERLQIDPSWRIGGGERWRTARQYVTDGANLWYGPKDAFAAAAWRETFSDPAELPRLTVIGLEAVRRKCVAASGRRLPPINGHIRRADDGERNG
jgi:hypothetical protein